MYLMAEGIPVTVPEGGRDTPAKNNHYLPEGRIYVMPEMRVNTLKNSGNS
jgi:hypothetical protein